MEGPTTAPAKYPTRRHLLTRSGVAGLSGIAAAALPLAAEAGQEPQPGRRPDRLLKVLVAGGHPGDPEAGCGGTIARFTQEGHQVTCLYLTRGEAGVSGKTAEQAAAVRTGEAQAACKILKATAAFAGQADGATEVTRERAADFARLVAAAEPDVVLTQWPIDGHADHRACAALTIEAWVRCGRKFALYYYEVDLGTDTQCFRPTCYVDVTATEALKREACMAHRSQDPDGFYNRDHVPMMRFRGMESGRKLAEAFVHHDPSPRGYLPG